MTTVRLYHTAAGLYRFTATVLECVAQGGHWAVVLDRTAFYAASGGQPHDTGTLGGRAVLDVALDETRDVVLHLLDGGVEGEVTGEVDIKRRRDHCEQHTGQHLLSQAFVEVVGAETVSFHIGEAACTIDLAVGALDSGQVAQVESRANALVRENRPVRVHWAGDANAAVACFPLRKPPAVTGPVRIVEIAEYNWSACGGTHVTTTGELGLIKVKGWERHKSGVRVSFLVGGRALADYQFLDRMVRELTCELTISPGDLSGQVQRYRDEIGRLRKQLKNAREELLGVEAGGLVASARVVAGVRIVKMVFAGRPVDEIKVLATRVASQPRSVALFATRGAIPQLVFARSTDLRLDMGAVLQQVLPAIDGKGGGSPVVAQGAGKNAGGVSTALEVAVASVAERLGSGRH